jgi:hypothetical protein
MHHLEPKWITRVGLLFLDEIFFILFSHEIQVTTIKSDTSINVKSVHETKANPLLNYYYHELK